MPLCQVRSQARVLQNAKSQVSSSAHLSRSPAATAHGTSSPARGHWYVESSHPPIRNASDLQKKVPYSDHQL